MALLPFKNTDYRALAKTKGQEPAPAGKPNQPAPANPLDPNQKPSQPASQQPQQPTVQDPNQKPIQPQQPAAPQVPTIKDPNQKTPAPINEPATRKQIVPKNSYESLAKIEDFSNQYTEANKPKVYESAGSYGSGFVNLSHLLGLNRKSGLASAKDLAKRTSEKGKAALGSINKAEEGFKKAADGSLAGQYAGPDSISQSDEYKGIANQVGEAEDMAKNTQSGWGIAAQAAKDSQAGDYSLSPRQAAASAYYMGVNNQGLKQTGSAFLNLRKALADANARSMEYSKLARQKPDAPVAVENPRMQIPEDHKNFGNSDDNDGNTDIGHGTFNEFMQADPVRGSISTTGMSLSPVDLIWNNIPGLGARTPSQMFSSGFTGGASDHPEQGIRNTLGRLTKEFGGAAAQYLWDHMTEEMWNGYLEMNERDLYDNMSKWLRSAGFSEQSGVDTGAPGGNDQSELQDIDKGIDEEDARGPNGEPSRNDAAREGWLTSYDEQKRKGVKYPIKP